MQARFASYHGRGFLLIAFSNCACSLTDSSACSLGKSFPLEGETMRQWPILLPDLFTPPRRKVELTAEQKLRAMKLLVELLKESMDVPDCSDDASGNGEIGDDQDHG
jgi:hypothetical protein